MTFLITLISIWFCSFTIARLLSIFGGKWSPFGKTYWKNDLIVTLAQTVIIMLILIILNI
jgi:hypothetical protein